MPIIRAQVEVPAVSTVSEDEVTNTWHFTTTGWTTTIRDALVAALALFYEGCDNYKSNQQKWQDARVKFFDLSEPEPRIPLDDESLGLTSAPTGSVLPPELSVVVSFRGDYVSGFSQARRRGRIYFGPLLAGSVGTDGRLSATAGGVIRDAASSLLAASDAASDWAWVVYSPTGDQSYPVVEGWVDNDFDVQRGRGLKATARYLFDP